jgi:hypothetical protein
MERFEFGTLDSLQSAPEANFNPRYVSLGANTHDVHCESELANRRRLIRLIRDLLYPLRPEYLPYQSEALIERVELAGVLMIAPPAAFSPVPHWYISSRVVAPQGSRQIGPRCAASREVEARPTPATRLDSTDRWNCSCAVVDPNARGDPCALIYEHAT